MHQLMEPLSPPVTDAALVACAGNPAARPLGEPVATAGGLVSINKQEILALRGMPCAAATVGPLRRRRPQTAPTWRDVCDASRFGPDCMQPPKHPERRGK